jgi:hypothetical protein
MSVTARRTAWISAAATVKPHCDPAAQAIVQVPAIVLAAAIVPVAAIVQVPATVLAAAIVPVAAAKARRVQAEVKARPLRVRAAVPVPAAAIAVLLLEAALVEVQWPSHHAVTPVSVDVAVEARA